MIENRTIRQQSKQTMTETLASGEEFYNSPLFTQAVVTGDTLWLSGLLGDRQDEARGFAVDEQVRIALQNLARALERVSTAVATIADVAINPIDLKHLSKFDWQEDGLDTKRIPLWTAVGILESELVGYQIEVKAITLDTNVK